MRSTFPQLARDPLVHFLLLGALLFFLFALFGSRDGGGENSKRIVIPAGLMENLALSFKRSAGRAPSPEEMERLVDDYVREEIMSREARLVGFDRDDPIVRRQLRQRMEFLMEGNADLSQPTDAQLRDFLRDNPAEFARADGSVPELEEVRSRVARHWQEVQRQRALDAAYAEVRKTYIVVVEKSP